MSEVLEKVYRINEINRQRVDVAAAEFSRMLVDCSGSMIPDTNVGGNIATINEVSDDQKATFFFS